MIVCVFAMKSTILEGGHLQLDLMLIHHVLLHYVSKRFSWSWIFDDRIIRNAERGLIQYLSAYIVANFDKD